MLIRSLSTLDAIHQLFDSVEAISVQGYDERRRVVYWNVGSEIIYGYTREEALGQKLEDLIIPGHMRDGLIASHKAWIEDGMEIPASELVLRHKQGRDVSVFSSHVMFCGENGEFEMYCIDVDLSAVKQAEELIHRQAYFDDLTSLPNRFLSLDRLSQIIGELKRTHQKAAVLFLDTDDFKKVNDSLGHEVGDKLLIEVAGRLKASVRGADTVGRLGGDEFIVIMRLERDSSDAVRAAEELLERFREPFVVNGIDLRLTLSIGIAVYPENGPQLSELLRNADAAMYQAKAAGRNTYSFFTRKMNDIVVRRLEIESRLSGALERDEFEVYFQPKVDVKSGSVIGAEALIRWHNPELGNVPPDDFIPIAENNGLIVPIGDYVLKQALMFLRRWRAVDGKDYSVAVNISPRQFRDKRFAALLEQSLAEENISPSCLEIEVTEGVLMLDKNYISVALNELYNLGVSLSMDDFGTGYSSLSYLRQYTFDFLKIDRSFVNGIASDKADADLVKATIAMAHSLGLEVVAEGVETREQLSILEGLGCDIAQGYLFSKPVPAGELIRA